RWSLFLSRVNRGSCLWLRKPDCRRLVRSMPALCVVATTLFLFTAMPGSGIYWLALKMRLLRSARSFSNAKSSAKLAWMRLREDSFFPHFEPFFESASFLFPARALTGIMQLEQEGLPHRMTFSDASTLVSTSIIRHTPSERIFARRRRIHPLSRLEE
ncbi:hypothetical protein RSAG8_09923, partial [Rhizoctonia solani AG-8 WAC10335]